MLLLTFYHCICDFLVTVSFYPFCHSRSFNPSLCRLSPFHLSYVTVSRPCRLSELKPNRASGVKESFFMGGGNCRQQGNFTGGYKSQNEL